MLTCAIPSNHIHLSLGRIRPSEASIQWCNVEQGWIDSSNSSPTVDMKHKVDQMIVDFMIRSQALTAYFREKKD
jgi:hypothetical protein